MENQLDRVIRFRVSSKDHQKLFLAARKSGIRSTSALIRIASVRLADQILTGNGINFMKKQFQETNKPI
jgi:hypothetical protein